VKEHKLRHNEIQSVAELEDGIFLLFLVYDDEEQEQGEADGHIYLDPSGREGGAPPTEILATSDTLRSLWASPDGSLWTASSDGNVATTADLTWSVGPKGSDYKTLAGKPWKATALPACKPTGLAPNIDLLWGLEDRCVYAGADGGHIYLWNGKTWAQVFQGSDDGSDDIAAFGGNAPDNIYAVGVQGTLLHFDGMGWRRLALPPPMAPRENLTGVHVRPNGEVFISTALTATEGRLLHGSETGLAELARSQSPLIAMGVIGDRLLFATGDGVAEFRGGRVDMIKSTFETGAMFSGIERIFFVEPAQTVPSYIEYSPRIQDAPWWRYKF
jgi:hypothetical protein